MDFSLRRINGENIHYAESETDSDIQLVFTPGSFNPDLWNNQLRYFSKKYKTIAFQPTESYRDFEGEKGCLKAVLEQEKIQNAVLVSNTVGNSVVSSVSDHESVQTTVMTGFGSRSVPGGKIYRTFWSMAKRSPKILRKSLFSQYTDYRVLKEFMRDVDVPDYRDIESFMNQDMVEGDQLSLIINADEDRFSKIEEARKMNARLSMINRAGTFSFYEKPQDYNKALNDFLDIVEEKVRKDKIMRSAEENRSLIEFDDGEKKELEVPK
ncbi:MAG: pimeloyl-ACP methyl ester carboxylesterase [Candidatus Nanohaloarchaea archaeon]|jgi:pimeloyl-ACP methyl ester carboxylesterase